MKKYTKFELAKLLKISGDLLEETHAIYQNFNSSQMMLRAIDCYDGVVFQEIHKNQFQASQLDYMNNHVVILSAMYGALFPNTWMWPYRLDMTNRPRGIQLYAFWADTMRTVFAQTDTIIDLASEEFSRMLSMWENRMIHIHFCEEKVNGLQKVPSYHAKQARGRVANRLIEEKIQKAQDIVDLTIEGFRFHHTYSDQQNYFLIRN